MPVQTWATITPLSSEAGMSAVTLNGWTGWIPDLQAIVDPFRRVGERGSGTQEIGQEGERTACTGWKAELTPATAFITIKSIEKFQGKVVTILDPWGRTIPRAKIHAAKVTPGKGKGPVIGSTQSTVLLSVSLSVERLPDV